MNGAIFDDSKSWGNGRPPSDRRWNEQGLENDFTRGKGQHPMGGEFGSNPPNWGQREINQTTPWDMPPAVVNRPPPQGFHADGMQQPNRFMPPNMSMDNGTSQWKSWTPMPGLIQQPWDAMHPPNGSYGAPMPPYGQQPNGPVGILPPPLSRTAMPPQMPMDPQMQQATQWNGNRAPGFVAPPANWCQPGAPPSLAGPPLAGPEQHPQGRYYDPNPQNPGPWVTPQNVETNYDMFWHDPNAKMKKVQRDTGTSVWGDPGAQRGVCEIRRWKTVENEDYAVSSAVPSGGDWSTIPISSPSTEHEQEWSGANNPNVTSADGTERWAGATATTPSGVATWGEGKDNAGPHAGIVSPTQFPGLGTPLMDQMRGSDGLLGQPLEQIQLAVTRGLISAAAVAQLTKDQRLQELRQTLHKLFTSEGDMIRLQQQPRAGATFKSEQERLVNEINIARNELQELQRNLGGGSSTNVFVPSTTNGGSHSGSLPTDSQSRLQQWKKNGGGINGNGQPQPDPAMASLVAGTQSLHINTDDRNDTHWKTGELNWSTELKCDALLPDSHKPSHKQESFGNAAAFNGGNSHSGHGTNTGNTPTPPVDDGPPAFIPGKKWEWRDPNKAAEDPNATPGTCKPNNFLLTAANFSSLNSVWSSSPNEWDELRNDPSQMSDMRARHQSNPAGLMQRPPFPMFGNNDNFWILFQLTNVQEQQVGAICARLSGLHCLIVVGHKIACAKLKNEVNVDAVLQRIKAEFAIGPQELKVVPDEEFDKMMRATRQSNVPVTCAWSANGEVGPLSNA
ncbi:hypothetical protein AAVH_04208 [Aphelenchoides avenae]|nr:hypothetical protein AAVH_04208 [Aphelenchus avenae]